MALFEVAQNRERRIPRWTFRQQDGQLLLESFESTDSGANDHTETVSSIQLLYVDPAILDCHFCCCHRQLRESIGAADILRIFEEWLGIEIANLSTDFAIVRGGIERVDGVNTANAVLKIGPKRFDIIAKRRNGAETSDNNSAIGVHLAI